MHIAPLEVFDNGRFNRLCVRQFHDANRNRLLTGQLCRPIAPRSRNDLEGLRPLGPDEQRRKYALAANTVSLLFRRPFCCRTSRMALGRERSAFRATHNGSAERKRNRGIRVRESEGSCHGQVERPSSVIHAEGVREYCSADN